MLKVGDDVFSKRETTIVQGGRQHFQTEKVNISQKEREATFVRRGGNAQAKRKAIFVKKRR